MCIWEMLVCLLHWCLRIALQVHRWYLFGRPEPHAGRMTLAELLMIPVGSFLKHLRLLSPLFLTVASTMLQL